MKTDFRVFNKKALSSLYSTFVRFVSLLHVSTVVLTDYVQGKELRLRTNIKLQNSRDLGRGFSTEA